jgi:ethanolamine ammonia-lyase large subunit
MSQDELECLKVLLATAGCSYLMSLPVGDDIMLNYQSTSFHDIPSVRTLTGRKHAPEFDAWLAEKDIWRGDRPGERFGDPAVIR